MSPNARLVNIKNNSRTKQMQTNTDRTNRADFQRFLCLVSLANFVSLSSMIFSTRNKGISSIVVLLPN